MGKGGEKLVKGLHDGQRDAIIKHEFYGYNELEKHEDKSFWHLILDQLNDTLVRILLAVAIISFMLACYDGGVDIDKFTAFVDPLVIFLILIVNAMVGFWQESNAEKALEALKEIQSEQATVIRDGTKIHNLPAKELVPGDVVELRAGDTVPADMRVVDLISSTLRVEQGLLTGESEVVNKNSKVVDDDADIQGKRCMVFAGTTVVKGTSICLVTGIGMKTEIGKVHEQIHMAAQSEEDTPLKKKLNEFGEALTKIIGIICVLVWIINVKYFFTWDYVVGWPMNFRFSFEKCTYYFEIAVALAVAAIPEGLPAVIALGTRKMAQKNALVRKLPSVETLGCTTVICSDKTGTLMTNQMAVVKLVAIGDTTDSLREFKVEGTSYNPFDGRTHDWPTDESDLTFIGLVGLRDPPREEVFQSIKDCRAAGIRVIVITGDHKNTAEAICCDIGVFRPGEDIKCKSLTGKEFMGLQDKRSHLRQSGGLLFSRAEPKHKQEIVRLLKEDSEVVAMTGDGVNDATALKLANIGIAMGIAGTEVAKEALDMVLADDNFNTIVAAVAEGRSIYNNMKAFIRYMISSNIGEVASPMLWVNPVQLLWVIGLYVGAAMVGVFIIWYTHDSFLGIDLSGDGHSLITYSQLANWDQCSSWKNFTISPFTAGAQTFRFDDNPCDYFKQHGKVKATTLSLSVLVAVEVFNSLNALSEDTSLLVMPPWVNPWLLIAMSVSLGLHFVICTSHIANVFGIVPLGLNEWILVLVVAFPVISIDEALKFVGRHGRGVAARCSRILPKPKSD
ncbi:Calcium-transporting ATPase 4, endoplasmic reticulum-type [Sesamum alatum]|uniref:P-type Ca(2+) transporter n=1 Tax=Sesamum alatum TaxID=300844 RepID=A0AAE2CEI3_9LAMI|nr:Calcium-transporting ATPase 4, endoplasmic reticulum-type [Sesamum alatum]